VENFSAQRGQIHQGWESTKPKNTRTWRLANEKHQIQDNLGFNTKWCRFLLCF